MALEDLQRTHNRVITDIGNTSASNDPKQIPHDATDGLLKGAAKLAAGQQLGLSTDETLALISRMTRRQKNGFTEADALRQLQQAAQSLGGVSEGAELRGVGLQDDPGVDPFGQDQSEYYEYQEGDRQYDAQNISKIQDEMYDMEDRDNKDRRRYQKGEVVLKTGVNPEAYDELAEDLAELLPTREEMTPRVALQQTLNELNAANEANKRTGGLLSRVFGGGDVDLDGYAQVAGALEDEIDFGRRQSEADASIAGETANRDSLRFNAENREANYYRAETDALAERRRLYGPGGQGAIADRNLARIGSGRPQYYEQILQRRDGIYLDESGNTVALQGPERPALMGSNTPSNAQALNAPGPQSAQSWVAQQVPDNYEGGRVYGDYPQVDITGTTTEFASRLRGVTFGDQRPFQNVSPQIRSINELQKVVDAIVRIGGAQGVKFGTKEVDEATGRMKTRRSTNPGAQEVMNFLRYTPAEQGRIASALFQLDQADQSGINPAGKQAFFSRSGPAGFTGDINFDAADALPLARPDESQAQVARVNPGQTLEGKDIVTQLRGLELPAARQPFIGAVVSPETGKIETDAGPGRITRFNRSGATGEDIGPALTVQAEARARQNKKPVDRDALKRNITKARLTDERAKRDAKKRQQKEADIAARRGPAPAEPSLPSAVGYGDELRQVVGDARQQSANMDADQKFIEKIRSIRGRR